MNNIAEPKLARHRSLVVAWVFLPVFIALSIPKMLGQETNRYTKVGYQVANLINAGDFPAIEKMFNNGMRQALPLEKATGFFTGLKAQVGTFQKLDEPVSQGGWMVLVAHCQRGLLDMFLALDPSDRIAGIKFAPRAATNPASEKPDRLPEPAFYAQVANRIVELINARDFAGIQTNFNDAMSSALPLSKSSAFFSGLTQQVGKLQKLSQPRAGDGTMIFPILCERGALDLQLALDNRGLISGLTFTPRSDSSETSSLKHETKLSLPLKGRWLVFWGGDTKELNHHHDVPAQRFAFDLVGVDENGKTHRGEGANNEDYFCFGREVYAPADGVIVEAVDGVRDNQPGVMNPYSLVGNCVLIQHRTNEVSVLAHFQRGSVVVKAGDQVKRGQLLGRCGNSGNSSEPHLHYQLQDTPVFQNALGIKVLFQHLATISNGRGEMKADYSPVKGDIISPGE